MAGDDAAIGRKAEEVRDLLKKFEELSDKERARRLERARDGLEALAALIEAAARPGLVDFFAYVGKGMVEAQRALDQESAAYLERDRGAYRQPTLFRIPKASAEFRFAMRTSKSTGFDIVIVSDKEEQREENEQRVQFEVVAAPLPPDLLQDLARRTARNPLVWDPAERRSVAALLPQALARLSTSPPELWNSPEVLDRLLIFRLPAEKAGRRLRWFLVYVEDQDGIKFTTAVLEQEAAVADLRLPEKPNPVAFTKTAQERRVDWLLKQLVALQGADA